MSANGVRVSVSKSEGKWIKSECKWSECEC